MPHRARSGPRLRGGSPPNSSSSSSSPSSSSDFEFTVSLSPSSTYSTLCPADELFYKGQLLPLHLSPRISMVRTLLLSSSSSSSDSTTTTTTASRDSTSSSSSSSDLLLPDSSRPSSATADEDRHPLPLPPPPPKRLLTVSHYFSSLASRFLPRSSSSSKRSTPKEVFKKYVKKVKPLFSKKSDDLTAKKTFSFSFSQSQSFSGNLRCPRRRTCVGSCPSSMRSSPSHSGLLYAGGTFPAPTNSSSSSMEELQSAIQGAIAHCKSSLVIGNQNKGLCSLMVSSDKNSGA